MMILNDAIWKEMEMGVKNNGSTIRWIEESDIRDLWMFETRGDNSNFPEISGYLWKGIERMKTDKEIKENIETCIKGIKLNDKNLDYHINCLVREVEEKIKNRILDRLGFETKWNTE